MTSKNMKSKQDDLDFSYLDDQGHLKVSEAHEIWYGVSGNPDGVPVINFHGGPGSVSKPKHKDKFDSEKVFLVQFDQRGAGQSKPQGETKENTTNDLLADTEELRKHLGIDKWIVAGGSWGSTMALLYAEKYPENVSAIAVDSIFLARREDFEWLGQPQYAAQVYPDVWGKTVAAYAKKYDIQFDEILEFAHDKIMNGSFEEQQEVAAMMRNWEGNIMSHENSFEFKPAEEIEEDEINSTKIFIHYEKNGAFLKPNQILKEAEKIKDIPTVILHGRFDMVCPLAQAMELHEKLENSTLEIVNAHGHHFGNDANIVRKYMFDNLVLRVSNG